MSIRWRLGVLILELGVLAIGTYLAVGEVFPPEVWFASGLLAVVINPLLLEPFYPRPADVIAQFLLALLLFRWSDPVLTRPLWLALLATVGLGALLAVGALLLGANKQEPSTAARAMRGLSGRVTARLVYSAIFGLSVLEEFRLGSSEVTRLAFTWLLVIVLGLVNWEHLWSVAFRRPVVARVEGLQGPRSLLMTSGELPPSGSSIQIAGSGKEAVGKVIARIRRPSDDWAIVHANSASAAEGLLRARSVSVSELDADTDAAVVGSVGARSTDKTLAFMPTVPLRIGEVVAVEMDGRQILYQLQEATIEETSVRGGSHLMVSALANQVGYYDGGAGRLVRHNWTPEPGAPVLSPATDPELAEPRASQLLLGSVLGCSVPVYLDLEEATEGHIVILGMTKMGKTTLALRLANALGASRPVVILDQTGEYSSRRGVSPNPLGQWNNGVSVHEPAQGAIGPDFANDFVAATAQTAAGEYAANQVTPRSIFLEEAHQFVPEPAGIGFNAPGRDSAYALGVAIMQLRKYGISMVLISQRTAVVAKSALSQCETIIAFRSVDQTGLDYLEQIAGGGIRSLLPSLRQGEALVMGPAVSSDAPVAIKVATA